jgi:cyclic pyranopterin phosphate synthase
MPEPDYVWLPREHILSFEEIGHLVDIFSELGLDQLKITGGEPLLRRELYKLVRMLAEKPAVRDLSMTTNGVLLAEQAKPLREAGLRRVTVSLDTLRPERFRIFTGHDLHARVLEGIRAASKAAFEELKLNMLVLRGVNEDEMAGLLEHGKEIGGEVRFIEYMDVGGATRWSADQVFPRAAMLDLLAKQYGPIRAILKENAAPADRFHLPDGTAFGIIASTTAPFCRDCDRSRLTADGLWYLCLYGKEGIDLRERLRRGESKEEIRSVIIQTWQSRRDRGAEERLGLRERGPLFQIGDLKSDPHLEMHTRGG